MIRYRANMIFPMLFRVKYEEQKASQSQKLQLEEESSKLGEPSSELTTQFYIYVYGTLMAILFTLALTR